MTINRKILTVYGTRLEAIKSIKLSGLVEKPSSESAPSNLEALGRYILPSRVLNLLEDTVAGIGREIRLTDALDELLKSEGLNAFETDAATFNCGDKKGFLGPYVAVSMQDPKIRS
jgi:UTP--glucose-1-phosphate uridylyltransferase